MSRIPLVLVAAMSAACSPAPANAPASAPAPSTTPASLPTSAALARPQESFEATVQIDPKPGDKAFQGVWLAREDGERWVIAYRAEPWFQPFEGQRVRVTGERFIPEGQAIMAPHFRVDTLRRVDEGKADPSASPVIGLGPEQQLEGVFEDRVGAPGTKLEGEPYRVFTASGGESFLLSHAPEDAQPGRRVLIRARAVELSPYMARRGGPTLWVLEVEPVP